MHPARTRRVCPLLVLALLGAGCATTIRAQVLDAETRQPIPGAVVLGVWTKVVGIGLSYSETVGVRETETDAGGQFELQRLGGSGLRHEEAITVYKPGYVAWSNLYIYPTSEMRENQRVPREILLGRFPPWESHRRHLDFIDGATRASVGWGTDSTPKFREQLQPEVELAKRERR